MSTFDDSYGYGSESESEFAGGALHEFVAGGLPEYPPKYPPRFYVMIWTVCKLNASSGIDMAVVMNGKSNIHSCSYLMM